MVVSCNQFLGHFVLLTRNNSYGEYIAVCEKKKTTTIGVLHHLVHRERSNTFFQKKVETMPKFC